MKSFIHHDAQSIDEAVRLLKTYKGKALLNAGGTDLLGSLKQGTLKEYPEALINIKPITKLDYIKEEKEGLRIGALATLADVTKSPTIRKGIARWQRLPNRWLRRSSVICVP